MFGNFFKRDPLSPYKTEISVINDTLFLNLYQDVFYANFPTIPTGSHAEILIYHEMTIKQRISFGVNAMHILTVLHYGRYVGTLTKLKDKSFTFTLPEGISNREGIPKLLAALLTYSEYDNALRTTPRTPIRPVKTHTEPSGQTSNVIPFPTR
jgi:hypothetical protein